MSFVSGIITAVLALSLASNFFRTVLYHRRKLVLLEAKVEYLFEKSGLLYEPISTLTPTIRKAVADGKKIEAIKLYRDAKGCSLKEAKAAIEKLML